MKPKLYLFDLDGTLTDSAPDLAASANHLREVRGLEPVPYETLRPLASSGARGLLFGAFGITPKDPGYKDLEKEFLDYYQDHLKDNPLLFPGVRELIDGIRAEHAQWGIVTNKHARFTEPLLEAVGLTPDVLVCGDTLDRRKPFPDQILHALWKLDRKGSEAVYVGDDLRDIQAAQAAGVTSAVANWGYLGSGIPTTSWGADYLLSTPLELLSKETIPH